MKTIINFLILGVVAYLSFYYIDTKAKEVILDMENILAGGSSYESDVTVNIPKVDSMVVSPLKIVGSAPGTWFFEAVIIGKVTDKDGNVLGVGPLMATEEWMTVEDVPFEGILTFEKSKTKTGFVVIESDDPSGMGRIKTHKVPVMF